MSGAVREYGVSVWDSAEIRGECLGQCGNTGECLEQCGNTSECLGQCENTG